MKQENNNVIKIILFILGCITILPLFKIGFVSGDDLEYFLTADPSRWIADSKVYAEGTGRFYFYIVKWIYSIPYLIDSKIYYYFCFITPIITTFTLFIWLVKRVTKSREITLGIALLCSAFLVYFAKHSAITAYPLYFTLSLTLFFLSLHFYVTYHQRNQYKHLIISASIFGLASLFYECYLVYYFLYLFLIVSKYSLKDIFLQKRWKMVLKEFAPYFIMGVIYLTIYVSYYVTHQSGYGGNQIASNLSFSKMMKTLFTMSFHSLPFITFFDYKKFFIDYALTEGTFNSYLALTLHNISILAYLKGVLAGVIIYFLSKRETPIFSNDKLIWGIVLSVMFIILPHFPLAVSEKYTSYIQKTYITTSFSFFSVIIFLVTLFLFVKQNVSKGWLKKLFLGVFSFLIVTGTIVTQYTNERVTDDMKISQYRFDLIEDVFQKEFIPEGLPVYMDALNETSSYFCKGVTRQSSPFSNYIEHQNGVKTTQYLDYKEFYESFKNSDQTVSVVYFSQADKTGDACLILSFLKGQDLQPDYLNNRVERMIVGYISPYKTFSYGFDGDSLYNGSFRGMVSNQKGVGEEDVKMSSNSANNRVSLMSFRGENLNPSSFMISNLPYPGFKR